MTLSASVTPNQQQQDKGDGRRLQEEVTPYHSGELSEKRYYDSGLLQVPGCSLKQ